MSRKVFIVDGARTPILKARSGRGPFSAADLAVQAGRPLLMRNRVPQEAFDEVILGCVMSSAKETNIGRVAALRLGFDLSVPAWTVQRNCASGMQALDSAMNRIQLGHSDLVLAGGCEAMSHAPVMFNNNYVNWLGKFAKAKQLPNKLAALLGFRLSMFSPVFALEHGLTDPVVNLNMGQTAEIIADRFDISRQQMDEFSVRSHQRAAKAFEEGAFNGELVPVFDSAGNVYESDDGVRVDSTIEKLATLKPVFDKPYGKVTAGNSSQISDGAALFIVASENAVEKYDLKPLTEIKTVQWAALDPAQMGLGPTYATAKVLQEQGLELDDIDYWEYNEAFAAQVLACLEALRSKEFCNGELGLDDALGEIDQERLNIHGGAVACGHPVGMSGARIVLHLANVLRQTNSRRGIASLCIGGGQGGATLIENLSV